MLTDFLNGGSTFIAEIVPALFAVDAVTTGSDKGYSFSWGIVLFFMILGLLVTLSPARRTYEVKKPKDE